METKAFTEIKDTVQGLIENLQQKTGNEPKEVVWKLLTVTQGIEPENGTQTKFKEETLNQIEELYPDFLLNYGKNFNESKLKTILTDLDDNTKCVAGDKDFELYNYINQVKNRVVGIKAKDTHKTDEQLANEIFKEMEYNFQVVHDMNEFIGVEKESTEYIKDIKDKCKRIHKNNTKDVFDKISIGTSSVKLHNLELLHGDYVSSKIAKEFDKKFSEKYNFTKTTKASHIKIVLDEDSIKSYSKSNGKNKSELKIHDYIASLKSEECLEKTKNLTLTKLETMKGLKSIEDFNKVINGDDKPYNALKEELKKANEEQKIENENTMIKEEYDSIVSSLNNEIKRLGINPSSLTQKDYEIYRKMSPKDLILDLLKDKYKLVQQIDNFKSKYES